MNIRSKKVDKPFLLLTLVIVVFGYFIFSSASLGLLASSTAKFQAVTFNQLILGLLCGSIAAFITSRIPYQKWRTYAFYIFIISTVMMVLVFVPHIGMLHGGAKRWINIGSFSFQPAEFFKIGFVMYAAAWYASIKSKSSTFKYGTLPLIALIVLGAVLLLAQPDTDTFMVVTAAGLGIYLAAGGKWRDVFIMAAGGILVLLILIQVRPYLKQRIETFMDPSKDPTGSGYQIQQSLIAIGSGGLFGRGFGQSVQKFNFLPEPIGDSIFAVAGEEFGFVGTVAIVFLYLMFAYQGFRIAIRAQDTFGSYLVIGLIILITLQSYLNISSMLAITPLSGTPLLFVSQGGTALFFALASVGIILNVSKYQKKSQA